MLVILLYINVSAWIIIPFLVEILPRLSPLYKFPLFKISISVISKVNSSALTELKLIKLKLKIKIKSK